MRTGLTLGIISIMYQFLAIAVTLWIVKKSIVDDHALTLDEGFSIILIHVLEPSYSMI